MVAFAMAVAVHSAIMVNYDKVFRWHVMNSKTVVIAAIIWVVALGHLLGLEDRLESMIRSHKKPSGSSKATRWAVFPPCLM